MSETSSRRPPLLLVYTLLALPGAIFGSHLLQPLLWPLFPDSPPGSDLAILTANVVPSALAGIVAIGAAGIAGCRWQLPGYQRTWLYRCAPLLTVLTALTLYLAIAPKSPDLGLFSQVLAWPAIAIAAGVVVEPVARLVAKRAG
jgi:hypothetical protein